jgi:tetratricopeptide (TPR) repeat protein
MGRVHGFVRGCAIGLWMLSLLAVAPAKGAEPCEPVVGQFVSVEGLVEWQRSGAATWREAKLGEALCEGDAIRAGELSRATVGLINEAVLRVDQNSSLRLLDVTEKAEERSLLSLIVGAFTSFSRKPRVFDVNTPYLNASIEGTEFVIRVAENAADLTVFEGRVRAENDFGKVVLASGESALAEAGKAPVARVLVRPRDAVQWALYYPPVFYAPPDEFPSGPGWEGAVHESIEYYRRRDLQKALEWVLAVPQPVNDPRFFAYRASLLLAVGRVDDANADIERALKLKPNDSDSLALQAVIALVQNENAKALETAKRAVEADPSSATALVALSYAQQARFDLESARASLEKAVKVEPGNALAWARLAEIHSSFAELKKSLEAAQKAVDLDPDLSRTQTVLGFAYLMQVKTAEAKETFEKAIALDQADPLPRLGLGLTTIRVGDLHKGRREIEYAANLDPVRSIIRSYLGKAYYEEKRTELTDREYAIAKKLDPNDPTPYFYDAIQKQTTNRPVGALHDMQKAIELNDNRAVYRSRLLLDSDVAARSASLGRIYTDLGFQQLGLVTGWKSVNIDPTNFSAHRFLADTYSVLPRHEIARVSELLQSQLLQPLNVTPIQPRLAESNLFLISALGPTALSFNEFNPIFNRDGVTVQASGLVGENATYAGEGVVSGIYKKTSFSVGGLHYTTDGFRENADQQDDILNVFVQHELTPKTSILAEYRYRDTEFGDIRLKFFPESIFPTQRITSENNTIRIGARHAFSPRSIVLGTFAYQDGSFREMHEPFPQPGVLFVDFNQPNQSAVGGELQHLFRSRHVDLVSGGGYFNVDDELVQLITFGPPFIPGPPISPPTVDVPGTTDFDLQHGNLYAYSNIKLLKNTTITLGASYDHADSKYLGEVKDQFNPKFGVTWTPLPHTTVRAAVFRTLARTLISQQTLEPTQVAGFNQFFDDEALDSAWRYGGAIDQVFSSSIYGGLEFSRRDLTIPYLSFTTDPASPPTLTENWEENFGRAYLFWTPHEWVALRAEYIFERIKREPPVEEGAREADTHRVPLGVNFFHPSGLGASLTATYFNQEGEFGGFFTTDVIRKGHDDFWTVDMSINYRLPKRYGFITVGATNLFDQDFQFFDTDVNNASIQPDRIVFGKVTLAWP